MTWPKVSAPLRKLSESPNKSKKAVDFWSEILTFFVPERDFLAPYASPQRDSPVGYKMNRVDRKGPVNRNVLEALPRGWHPGGATQHDRQVPLEELSWGLESSLYEGVKLIEVIGGQARLSGSYAVWLSY